MKRKLSKSNIILLIVCFLEALTIINLLNIKKPIIPDPQIITRDSIIRDSIFILNEKIQKEFKGYKITITLDVDISD